MEIGTRYKNAFFTKKRLSIKQLGKIMQDYKIGDFLLNYVESKKHTKVYQIIKTNYEPTISIFWEEEK